jgi:DHA3 family macrolide efflux protein-like MFS transporter
MNRSAHISNSALARLLGGQFLSLVASGVSLFALSAWAYQKTGAAASVTHLTAAFLGALLVMSPIAGVLVDRVSKKRLMLIGDITSAATALCTWLLHASGVLEIWQLYLLAGINGASQAFHWPAYSSAITELVRARHYVRVNGFLSLAESGGRIVAPGIGGAIYAFAGLDAVLAINVAGSLLAAMLLISVPIAVSRRDTPSGWSPRILLAESMEGVAFIFKKPGLIRLLAVFFVCNFFMSAATSLIVPFVLATHSDSILVLGTVQSAGAIGALTGAAAIAAYGEPRRLIVAVLLCWIGTGMLGILPLGISNSAFLIAIGIFVYTFFGPIMNGCAQALWQRKVEIALQGRVFSIRRMIAWSPGPLATLLSGPLADRVFVPAMQCGGALEPVFGGVLGSGAGAGLGLLISLAGLFIVVTAACGFAMPALAEVDEKIPDQPHVKLATR